MLLKEAIRLLKISEVIKVYIIIKKMIEKKMIIFSQSQIYMVFGHNN